MRELKFRAWDTVKKTMHEGSKKPYMYLTNSERLIGIGCHLDSSFYDDTCRSFEDEIILMQYSDQKDKTSRLICEDDVVKFEYGIGRVFKCDLTSCFKVDFDTDADYLWLYCPNVNSKIEVIGNIHQNPDIIISQQSS